jgi:hypothetical protein
MAKTILRDVTLSVDGVDLSEHVQQIEFDESWPNVDVTGMGAAFTERLLGIGDASIKVTFFQDFASSEVHDTLQPLAGSNTPFAVVVTPVSGSVSTTNPSFTMQAVLDGYSPVKGKVGDASTMDVTFWNAAQTGVVIGTT